MKCNLLGTCNPCNGRTGDDAYISVRDSEIGIPQAMLDKVFDLFTQVEPTRQRAYGGLGIGLTLVKRLVEMHDGAISAESEGEGKGSQFIVRLPIGKSSMSAKDRHQPTPGLRKPDAKHRKVIVIDDNIDSAESLRALLTEFGYETLAYSDGAVGVDGVEAERPDLVFIDIGMPGMDGHEVARHLRRSPDSRHIPLVALTGWGQLEDRGSSRDAGFDRHLVKPISIRELQHVLDQIDKIANTRR